MQAKFGVTKRIGKLKTTRGWYFTHMLPRPKWGDRFEFWHVGSHRRCNHPRQIFCQLVQKSWSSDPQNLAISIGLAGQSYNSVSTAILHCDISILHCSWHSTTSVVYVTACDIDKSFNFDTVEITSRRHLPIHV